MAGDEEVARIKRLKRSCEVKRMNYMNKIRAVHSVAVRTAEDTSVEPQLLVMVESLDQLLSSFTIEDETFLGHLLDLELDNEYPDKEGVEMFELVSFAKATAHRFMQYCPDQTIVSTHGGSQGSLNEVGRNVPKSDEQVITDNVTIDVSPGAIQSNNAGSLRSNSVQVIKPARLPEIPLPTFEGNIYEWITFRDRFTTSVDRREHLSDIDKFYYLVGCCKGAARDAIRGIPVSDHNYKLAWSTLEERFNKPRLVACSLIEKLLNAQRASSESLVELNKLLVVFDEGVSLLESLNIPNLGDFILFSIASRCLPIYSIKLFEAQLANDPRLQRLYCDFMSEYLTLGHMSSAKSEGDYFIPHHAVYRPADIDPKIRVVFDASATSYSGVSLNDCLLPGPKLQRDVVDVLLLYRVHRFAFTTDVFSDCGTNFVGANNLLRALVNDPACRDQLTASVHCTWHLNPPGAPHFGGLWEAAVRSSKSLLMRIMGEHTFTIEEFGTVLCRCEAILNSRPITPASSDPTELDCLTPGHFLIGRPLLAVPEADISITTRSLEQRWKLVSQCVQAFWRRWRNEYLQTLQIRSRWTNDAPNIVVDDMVVIKDAHAPPLKWRMGRVIDVLPGADKVVRVVRLRTATGIVTRPVVKVVKLINQP
eukprot:XP_016658947.1 PREDICTED: uncharacterized protein LOC107883439 [Acyrthosiphon pisum]